MSSKKESFSFVPQELSRHFIEPSSYNIQDSGSICINQKIFERAKLEEAKEIKNVEIEDNVQEETHQEYIEDDATLCAYEEEEEEEYESEEEDVCQPAKWSFVRGLFSKLSLRIGGSSQAHKDSDTTPFLSTYGALLNKRIGEGVSATVQLTQRNNEEIFAVKIFRKKKKSENSAGYMKALAGEFCISSALNHPNVIKTLDFVRMDEDHSRYCIVMEYCPEGDMYTLIKQGKIQDDQMYTYLKQLLLGLDYLHSLGVAHRDLKPENLLINRGTLKIADFGSADVFRVAWQDHSRLSDGLCGTTPYMAPEIFLDQGYWAAPVDVWAAGVIFFCMKFDGVPFGSAQKNDTNYPIYLRKRPSRGYDPFNKLAHDPRILIYAMLNPDPNRRVTIQDILSMPWMQTIPSTIQT